MIVSVEPSTAKGIMQAPPSKSMGHRMLICAGLSSGECIVNGIAPSQDMLATIDCLRALGAKADYDGKKVTINGIGDRLEQACNGNPSNICEHSEDIELPCRECGSTMRFFVPIALLTGEKVHLSGSETLLGRPMTVYEDICQKQGIEYELTDKALGVKGLLAAGEYVVRGDISSQFISGLLFALPILKDDSTIKLLPPVESRSYINMTIEALEIFGVKAVWTDENGKPDDNGNCIKIKGNQKYKGIECTVEGDYSNAAFLDAFNLIKGRVELTGLREDSLQGDKIYRKYYELLKKPDQTLDLSDCPDLGPVCMAMAAALNGAKFVGTRRLRIKESDRCMAMSEELHKMGIESIIEEDSMEIISGKLVKPAEVIDGHNDHRIVMAMTLLLTITGGTISGAGAVRKSLPDFFDRIAELGIKLEIEN